MMEGLERIVSEHAFFKGLGDDFLKLVTGCAKNVRFEAGQYLLKEGDAADQLYLIRHGTVVLETAVPGKAAVSIQTVGEGQIVGVSWLVPPYRWTYDARALDLTRAIAVDATCIRNKCESDHDLGYELMKRFMPIVVDRLHATRLKALDLYGSQR